MHDAVADAYGEALLVAPGGEIRRSLAELAGVDVIKGPGLFLSKDPSNTTLRCARLSGCRAQSQARPRAVAGTCC